MHVIKLSFIFVLALSTVTASTPNHNPPQISLADEILHLSGIDGGYLYASEDGLNSWIGPITRDSWNLDELGSSVFYRVVSRNYPFAIVDTNQLEAYDEAGEVLDPLPAPSEPFAGQDAAYIGNAPAYVDNGDGTVTDSVTGLMWEQVPPEAFYSWPEAQAYADELELAGHTDWRLPTMKELLSLADFNGSSRPVIDLPYIDTDFFTIHDPLEVTTFIPANTARTKRNIDGQFWSSDAYVGRTINNDSSTFGFNFIDGRIKGYPNGVESGPTGTSFVRCVRDNPDYGTNQFVDNRDGTITDRATGLMWLKEDSGAWPEAGGNGDGTMDWIEALNWAENLEYAGYDDWRLPDAKELQSIVDYTRAPDAIDVTRRSAAIDPVFDISEPESWFWTSTSLGDDLFEWALYVCFGQASAVDPQTGEPTINAHGAGAMRSDPKTGLPEDYVGQEGGHGPQNDQVRIFNYVRPVRTAHPLFPDPPEPVEPGSPIITIADVGVGTVELTVESSEYVDNFELEISEEGGPWVAHDPASYDGSTSSIILSLAEGTSYTFRIRSEREALYSDWVESEAVITLEAVKPNILLMIVDDWGIDSSDLYNDDPDASFPPMPVLEELAESGLVYENAYAMPTCSPTRATMLSGRYPSRHGIGSPVLQDNPFPLEEITLPEIFEAANSPYAVGAFGKYHLSAGGAPVIREDPNIIAGWQYYAGSLGGGVPSYFDWTKVTNGTVERDQTTYTTTSIVDDAIDWIDGNGNDPWFAWLAFNAGHTPFHVPPEELHSYTGFPEEIVGRWRRLAYEASLEALDTEIGRLLEEIGTDNTYVIVMGDNGTPGQVVQPPYDVVGAKGSLFEGGTHVPMIIYGPGVVEPGRPEALVHCVDLFATFLELAGIDPADHVPEDTIIDSQSIISTFDPMDPGSREYLFCEAFGEETNTTGYFIRDNRYKLLRLDGEPERFYDLFSSPYELLDLLEGPLSIEDQERYDILSEEAEAMLSTF